MRWRTGPTTSPAAPGGWVPRIAAGQWRRVIARAVTWRFLRLGLVGAGLGVAGAVAILLATGLGGQTGLGDGEALAGARDGMEISEARDSSDVG